MAPVNGQRYIASTVVLMDEVFKLTICLTIALYEISRKLPASSPATALFTELSSAVFTGDSWKLAIPAALYTLQSSLQYVAISNLEAATMQVTYQFKILPTAVFSIVLLRRTLSPKKWAALALLLLGVAAIQFPNGTGTAALHTVEHFMHLPRSLAAGQGPLSQGHAAMNPAVGGDAPLHKRSATYEGIDEDVQAILAERNATVGVAATLCACTVAAFASVYFEKIMKESTSHVSLWIRNVQLSLYSMFPALFIGVIFVDGEHIAKRGFFSGYNWVVWVVIACQSFGGIVVSLCLFYADNISKVFATSISILISLIMSVIFFDFHLTFNFAVGTSIVLCATWLYNSAPNDPVNKRGPPIRIDFEKKTPPAFQSEVSSSSVTGLGGKGDVLLSMPKTPSLGVSSSRPGTPSHPRKSSSYFPVTSDKRDS